MEILDCGHRPSEHSKISTGYGYDDNGKTFCYTCCAEQDKATMIKTGKITLYLNQNLNVGNWPHSLWFPLRYQKTGHHNIAGKRYDVWFNGPDGFVWHGVQYGDMTQLCHCKRTKEVI